MASAEPAPRALTILGVRVTDVTRAAALELMARPLREARRDCTRLYFVNAHTLNLADEDPRYRRVLNDAELVFNDGTGVRWAARQRGVELRDNLNGTDLIPDFLASTSGEGFRLFLLGGTRETIVEAADVARKRFAGWSLAGLHDGFHSLQREPSVVQEINESGADLLLVGMGNPLQESWIDRNRSRLKVSLAVGVGGLFDFWIERPRRAPHWVRRAGCEWIHKLLMQPFKWRRYLLGNPRFLYRMTRALRTDLAAMEQHSRGLGNGKSAS